MIRPPRLRLDWKPRWVFAGLLPRPQPAPPKWHLPPAPGLPPPPALPPPPFPRRHRAPGWPQPFGALLLAAWFRAWRRSSRGGGGGPEPSCARAPTLSPRRFAFALSRHPPCLFGGATVRGRSGNPGVLSPSLASSPSSLPINQSCASVRRSSILDLAWHSRRGEAGMGPGCL